MKGRKQTPAHPHPARHSEASKGRQRKKSETEEELAKEPEGELEQSLERLSSLKIGNYFKTKKEIRSQTAGIGFQSKCIFLKGQVPKKYTGTEFRDWCPFQSTV